MSLEIYYSDKIQELADDLKKRLHAFRNRPESNPMDFIQVIVPNTNIAKWLQIKILSSEPKLTAGIDFPFISASLLTLLQEAMPEQERRILPMPPHSYATAIMKVLLESSSPALAPFRKYISGKSDSPLHLDGRKPALMGWQLSQKLADLIDNYEVHRPDLIDHWLGKATIKGLPMPEPGSIEAAEAALVNELFGDQGIFPESGDKLSLRQLFTLVKNRPAPTGAPLFFFGHSTLSDLHVQILHWLSRSRPVIFYHNSVCVEFWGDIEKNKLKNISSVENQLLNSWGIAGRNSMNLLVSLEENLQMQESFIWEKLESACEIPAPRNVLEWLQSGIRTRTTEENKPGIVQDASLQIFGAPGIRREVETVYNAILGSVVKPPEGQSRPWSPCSFSDIAVLVPDMGTYRPIIEAVFDTRGEIPYGLIDTTVGQDSACLNALTALYNLHAYGLKRDTLFSVLSNSLVQNALQISNDDVANWQELAVKTGAFSWFDEADTARHNQCDCKNFTWEWALKRLRLSTIADAVSFSETEPPLKLPLYQYTRSNALRFSEIVELLYRELEASWGGTSRQTNWQTAIEHILDTFVLIPQDDTLEQAVRRQITLVLLNLRTVTRPQPLEFALEAIQQFVTNQGSHRGGYLTHGVTIAGLMPMRPVPFKQVFVLGLGEGKFPGSLQESTLDLRGLGAKIADTSLPEVNRYLFLETLMATGERLVLSYVNQDIVKDADLFPSSIITTLKEFIDRTLLARPFKELQIPLLERDTQCTAALNWTTEEQAFSGLLPTYSNDARKIACRQAQNFAEKSTAFPSPTEERHDDAHVLSLDFTAKDFADFLNNPIKGALHNLHKIGLKGYETSTLPLLAPLGLASGYSLWNAQQELLEQPALTPEMEYAYLQWTGQCPAGLLGKCDPARQKLNIPNIQNIRATIASWDNQGIPHVYGKNDEKATLPPSRLLVPFFSALFHLTKAENQDAMEEIKIGVIDLSSANRPCALWHWESLNGHEAKTYLGLLQTFFCNYLLKPAADGLYPSFTYQSLVSALEKQKNNPPDWEDVAKSIGANSAFPKKDESDHPLVLNHILEHYLRLPEPEEIAHFYETCYKLPLSGKTILLKKQENNEEEKNYESLG